MEKIFEVLLDKELWLSILAAIGALKAVARYTPWAWDDKLFDILEWPFRKILGK